MSDAPSEILWADTANAALMEELADFMAGEIKGDASYISHGEVQTGLSLDAKSWAPDVGARMREDFLDMEHRDVAYVRNGGEVVAASIIWWVNGPRVSFAVIEDMAVKKSARSHGLGGALVAAIETEVKARGMRWLFLESGLHNERAHDFFEREGFDVVSKVFMKAVG